MYDLVNLSTRIYQLLCLVVLTVMINFITIGSMFENLFETIKSSRKLQIGLGIVLIIALLALFLVVTGSSKPKQALIIEEVDYPVKLVWWKQYYGKEVYDDIIKGFKALPQYKNVEIEVIKKPSDNEYYKDLLQDISRGAGPDIFTISNDDLPAYKEYMTPITNINDINGKPIPDNKMLEDYKEKFVDLAVSQTIDRNQLYAITSYIENMQLYYNSSLLSQAGIVNPPATWADLDKQIPLLNKRDVNGVNFLQSAISLGTGFVNKSGEDNTVKLNINRFQDIIPLLLFQSGGQLYDNVNSAITFGASGSNATIDSINQEDQGNTQEASGEKSLAFQALKFYNSFADVNSSRYSWNGASEDNKTSFVEGRLAYILHYSYFQNEIKNRNPSLKYSIAKLPQLDLANKKTYGFFYMDGINKKMADDVARLNPALEKSDENKATTKKLQVARDFMHYLSQPQQQQQFADKTGLPSAHKDIINTQMIDGSVNTRKFAEGALYAENYYKPDVKRAEKIWGDMMYRVQFENISLEASLAQAVEEYSNIVADKPKIRF
jgi:ABC-type glycerol-3-phosphate transport system substrate-binding protein